jgi:short-subunit dehydrogenase
MSEAAFKTRTCAPRLISRPSPTWTGSSPVSAPQPGHRPTTQRAVIVGASSGVGRALAEELAAAAVDLVLVATDLRDLESLGQDLRLRFGVHVFSEAVDLSSKDLDWDALFLPWCRELGGCDVLLAPAGCVVACDDGLTGADVLETTLRINFVAVAGLMTACARLFERQGHGTLVAFSSIAAAVPRRRRMAYTASKAALEAYMSGLRHHFGGTSIRVQTYALGYVDSAMSYGQRLLLPAVSPRVVARRVVRHLMRDVGTAYCPRYWWAITRILRALPWPLFRRLQF